VKIGLIRHFPVEQAMPAGWKTAAELHKWRHDYELAGVRHIEPDLGGVEWTRCIASTVRRAAITANAVFPGLVAQTDLLREAEFAEFRTGALRLPILAWYAIFRLSWMTGHRSQRPLRDAFMQRVRTVAEELSAGTKDTLVVSHGGVMAFLSTELRRRGFVGPKFGLATHARTYVFERV
jgi:broad specificity phosphatase PhoE